MSANNGNAGANLRPNGAIDAHVHLYPDQLATKAVPALAARFGNPPSFDATVSGCRTKNRADGIALSINLPVATSPEHVRHTNEFWRGFAAPADGVMSLAALHPLVPDLSAEVNWIADAGFRGIKFHPEYQNFRFNDTAMDACWEAMSERGLVAHLHAGGERVFQAPFHSTPAEIAELTRRFPHLTVVAAHLGGFGMWDEVERDLAGCDLYLDLSHTFFWAPDAQIERIVRAHGVGRILFGSDAPWQDAGEVLRAARRLPLAPDELDAVCRGNAARVFALE